MIQCTFICVHINCISSSTHRNCYTIMFCRCGDGILYYYAHCALAHTHTHTHTGVHTLSFYSPKLVHLEATLVKTDAYTSVSDVYIYIYMSTSDVHRHLILKFDGINNIHNIQCECFVRSRPEAWEHSGWLNVLLLKVAAVCSYFKSSQILKSLS